MIKNRNLSHHPLAQDKARRRSTIDCEHCGASNPDDTVTCSGCGRTFPGRTQKTISQVPVQHSRWTKVCPRCGVVNGWTLTYCVQCGQSLRGSDLADAVPYDARTRSRMQEDYKVRSKRTLTRLSYVLTGALVLIILSLIFAPLSSCTLNLAVNGTGLTQTESYQVRVNGAVVLQGDIAPGTIAITTIPYHYPWAFTGQQQITVVGTAYGANSNHSGSQTLTVIDGGTYSVTLNL
jgi:ribosomal protein L40E